MDQMKPVRLQLTIGEMFMLPGELQLQVIVMIMAQLNTIQQELSNK